MIPILQAGVPGKSSLSICMPALNEEKSLEGAVEDLAGTLSGHLQKIEIIIVDDGSTDGTLRIAEQMARKYREVKIIRHLKKLGIGACYHDALALASGDYFTWFPADHENSAAEFISCLPYLSPDTAVTCHHLGGDPRPLWRRYISRSYTWLLNGLFRLNMKYYNGLTIFPIGILRSLSLVSRGFFFTAENIIKATKRGYLVLELSIPLSGRKAGSSKIFTLASFIQMLEDLLNILREQRRLSNEA